MTFHKIKSRSSFTLSFFCTSNNTIGSLLDFKEKTIFTFSTGCLGYKGSKKGSQSAAQHLAFFLGQEALKLGHSCLNLRISGVGRGRNSFIKELLKAGLNVKKISDFSNIAFNGCRFSKR